jgi:hypothetical protein
MVGMSGCGVKQSEYDAKAAEAKSQADKVAQLQKDFDAVKGEIDKAKDMAKQARKKDAEARTKASEQEIAGLKDRIKALEQENAGLKANAANAASQFEKDMAAARGETARVEQARKTAEARIKKLELDNAELQKKASAKPLDFLKKK